MNSRCVIALFALAAAACSSSPDDSAGKNPSLGATDKGPAAPVDHPPVDPGKIPNLSAAPQRVTIQSLRLSFPIALGTDDKGEPITWKLGDGSNGLDKMSDSLGEADFIDTTEDSVEPSPLYLKFMDDAARDVCNRALSADYARTDKSARVLLHGLEKNDTVATNPTGVDANLRGLKLRMHGVKVAEDDATTIEPLRSLFTTAVDKAAGGGTPAEADVKEGWRVVCVALLTAPEFHVY